MHTWLAYINVYAPGVDTAVHTGHLRVPITDPELVSAGVLCLVSDVAYDLVWA